MQNEATFPETLSRREFLNVAAGTAVVIQHAAVDKIVSGAELQPNPGPFQATGVRVGEVTESSAIVWTRLTKYPHRNHDGVVYLSDGDQKRPESPTVSVDAIEGACPGTAGRIRLRYGRKEDLSDAAETDWVSVNDSTDFIHQFQLDKLVSDSRYHYSSESTALDTATVRCSLSGAFDTAPDIKTPGNLRFCVMTCQGYPDRDHKDGHQIYPSMLALQPKFVTMTGDLVYYDNDPPQARTPELARLHWQRMFSLPRLIETLRYVSTYWLKDDHDTLNNDSGPGATYGELTFAEGQKIFRQQAPIGDASYRTFRWGRDLQLWLTDGRDYRSPNWMPDGPDKTIWGAEQKAWFKRTVLESDATWKVLISPTPLVGPDRGNKNDNHSNAGFEHEGNEIREWLKMNVPDNFFVVCGDRHWQYHSVHPTSGLNEFSVGAASDSHAGGTPGENKNYHRFHRVKGGFLAVELVSRGGHRRISFQLRDVHGGVVYEVSFDQEAA